MLLSVCVYRRGLIKTIVNFIKLINDDYENLIKLINNDYENLIKLINSDYENLIITVFTLNVTKIKNEISVIKISLVIV